MGSLVLGVLTYGALGGWWSSSANEVSGHGTAGWWILAMTCVVGIVSFIDDRGGISVGFRLAVHLAAAVFVATGGRLPFPSIAFPLWGDIQWGWLAIPMAVVFVVWMTNLYNFMDGMDGFAGGMTVVGFGSLAYFAWKANHQFMLVSATILAVASLGFLLHNFPPASIFMGDVGSVSIGFICASLILLGCRDGVFPFWTPIILFSPFIVDATVTLIRRALLGKKIWEAHRSHYYQRLVLLGWGHRRTVLAEYGLMCTCAVFAFLYQFGGEWVRLVVLLTWCMMLGSLMAGVRWAERAAVHSPQLS